MRKALVVVTAGLAVAVVVFLSGVVVGATGVAGIRPQVMTGDGHVGEQVATLTVGDTSYGVRSSVAWRDAGGAEHDGGWPACLPMGEVRGVRFAGAVVWGGGSVGQADVLWVDCQGR